MSSELPQDSMLPDASPARMAKFAGIRRVNNLPIFIVVGVVCVFAATLVIVGIQRSSPHQRAAGDAKPEQEAHGGATDSIATQVAGNRRTGFVAPKVPAGQPVRPPESLLPPPQSTQMASGPCDALAAAAGCGNAVPIARPLPNPDAVPLPPQSYAAGRAPAAAAYGDPDPDAAAKAQRLHLAMQARSSVSFQMTRAAEAPHDVAAARHQAMAAQADDPTSTYKAGLAQTRGGLSGASPGSATGGAARAGGIDSVGLSQFAGSAEVDRWRLDHRAEPPASPYELRAGSVIPATLISGINSELPGMILGQVAADVYDTATGRRLLIPQGARLVGEYSSNVAYGQSRVLVAWQRIVFPDGKALDLGAMPGADSAGYSGFNDLVDNHYLRIFGSAILMSAVTAGVTLSQPAQTTNTNGTVSAGTAMSEALGQQLGQTAAQMINKNMNIAPTLEIRPGYRFNVMATKDLVLAGPYRAFDY